MAKFADRIGKIAEGVVGGYKKIESAFVNAFLAKEGETVEDAKSRAAAERKAREEKIQTEAAARETARKEIVRKNLEASRNAGKRN